MKEPKFIFITGGVVSSLGKGISAASIGRLLKNRGLKVCMQKLDPYINVDPGTLCLLQHGEVFVTEDGAETDLDLGHYERFIDENLNLNCSITAGKVYLRVIEKERNGEFNGRTVQVIPHITNQIKEFIWAAAETSQADVVITEVGGTVGDFESLPFLEAIRQFRRDVGFNNVLYIHTTLVPYLKSSGEVKTKPTQHSVKELRALGISPDIIILRTEKRLPSEQKDKIALFCDVDEKSVIEVRDCKILYEVVNELAKQNIDQIICDHFKIEYNNLDLTEWNELIVDIKAAKDSVNIAVIGKYVELPDAYLSAIESLKHASYKNKVHMNIKLIDPNQINNENIDEAFQNVHGILLIDPTTEGIIDETKDVVRFARTNEIPLFGINNGLVSILREFCDNVLNVDIKKYMNYSDEKLLGLQKIILIENSQAYNIYQNNETNERFRTNLEISNKLFEEIKTKELICSGYLQNNSVGIIEISNHPWLLGCQYHPEFISRPNRPHPLFVSFVQTAIKYSNK